MSAPKVDVLAAERDARTIYDIACIREQSEAASREDVEFKAITLRNYQFCIAVAELIEADRAFDACNIAGGTSESWGRYYAAKARRAAALTNVGGQP